MLTAFGTSALVLGLAVGSLWHITQTNAQTPTSATARQTPQFDKTQGGHVGASGKKEEILAGTDAQKAKDAALKAVPGATVDRVETDAEGAVYEAHMTKSDGTRVTVKFDANFNVTTTESGMMRPDNAI